MAETEQHDKSQKQELRRRLPHWVRPVIISITLALLAGDAVVWLWKIWGDWPATISAIFTIFGGMSAFFAIPALYFSSSSEQPVNTPSAPSTPNIHINFAPNMTFSPYQQVSLPSSPSETDTFHNVAEAFSTSNVQHSSRHREGLPVGNGGKDAIPLSRFSSVFPFNGPLTDVDEFYGRVLERITLQTRTRNGTSSSIVGPRRIGKTWLMRYLMLTAPKEFGPRLRVGYLDATSPHCATVASFTAKALEELAITGTNRTARGLSALEDGVRDLALQYHLLILCIDEFEGLCGKQGFDLRFLEQLRAISQVGLVLVVASKRPILEVEKAIVNEDLETSPLHNILPQLLLKPFKIEEAKQFVKSKGAQAKFTQEEQSRLLQYGGQLPLRLQLTGRMIEEAKLAAKEDPSHFRPDDPAFWQEFEQRLEETYRTVVRV